MNKYLSNIRVDCSRTDVLMALLGVIPFIPASWYIIKILRGVSVNWSGIRHYDVARQHKVTKEYYGVEVL